MSYFDLLTSVSPKTTHIFLSTKQFCDREDPRKLLGPVIFNCQGGRVFGPPRTGLIIFFNQDIISCYCYLYYQIYQMA